MKGWQEEFPKTAAWHARLCERKAVVDIKAEKQKVNEPK